jgi:tRNA(Ile)-lysidine synthase
VLGAHVAVGTPLLAAVSGGADSVALVAALAHRPDYPLVGVAFVDHGLRHVNDERSAAAEAARRAGVPMTVTRVELQPGNLQARARLARYQALLSMARDLDPRALVATGHTRSDQAETVLARVLRGSGVPGLAGMAPRRGRIVRPLIEVSRAETRALGWPFVDDPSNESPRFQRNRLRRALAILLAESPDLESTLAALAGHARASTRLLDALAQATPELDLRGLDPETAQTWALHRARSDGAKGPSRAALTAWAEALVRGGLGTVSLGLGLAGRARGGRATVTTEEDPRRTVVARRPGTYRTSSLELDVSISTLSSAPNAPVTLDVAVAWFPGAPTWPLTLRPACPGEASVMGDDFDPEGGDEVGGWCVVDGAGRTLVPAAEAAPMHLEGRDGAEHGAEIWTRVTVTPFVGARRKGL